MVRVINVAAGDNCVDVTFDVDGLPAPISCRVYGTDNLLPHEICDAGWSELQPHVEIQLGEPTGLSIDYLQDEVVSITLLGIEDIYFVEGQAPIEKSFRCAGKTLYGKTVDLRDEAEFTPFRDVLLAPEATVSFEATASYNGLTDTKSFMMYYRSLADIEAENAARLAEEQAEAERLAEEEANRPPSVEEYLVDMDYRLTMLELGI